MCDVTEHRPPWPADSSPHERGLFQGYDPFSTPEAVELAFTDKYGYAPQFIYYTRGAVLAGPIRREEE